MKLLPVLEFSEWSTKQAALRPPTKENRPGGLRRAGAAGSAGWPSLNARLSPESPVSRPHVLRQALPAVPAARFPRMATFCRAPFQANVDYDEPLMPYRATLAEWRTILVKRFFTGRLLDAISSAKWSVYPLLVRLMPGVAILLHEPESTRRYWRAIEPGMLVVDGGANMGGYSLL